MRFLSCGGPTRTNDLQVMSLASYQLLHSAMLLSLANEVSFSIADAKVLIFSETAKKIGYFFVFVWVNVHFPSQKFVIFLDFT